MIWLGRLLAGLLVLGAALFAGGMWNATRPPVIERVSLGLPGLPAGTRLRVLHITDTHGSYPDMPRSRLEGIVRQANALRPDMIVLTGDYHSGKFIDWPDMRLEDALEPLSALSAPLGVYAVMGNHDRPKWTPLVMGRRPWPRLLVNDSARAGPLTVVGVDSTRYEPDPERAFAGIADDRPVLLLLHEPDHLEWMKRPARMRAQPRSILALAGHTHGGQVVLPVIGSLHKLLIGPQNCLRGLCVIGGQRVYVSSGVGTSGLPIRYGVPPEMVLVTLVPG